jgi:hypothetical protein
MAVWLPAISGGAGGASLDMCSCCCFARSLRWKWRPLLDLVSPSRTRTFVESAAPLVGVVVEFGRSAGSVRSSSENDVAVEIEIDKNRKTEQEKE